MALSYNNYNVTCLMVTERKKERGHGKEEKEGRKEGRKVCIMSRMREKKEKTGVGIEKYRSWDSDTQT